MKLGAIVSMNLDFLEEELAGLRDMGLPSCQLNCWNEADFTAANAKAVKALTERNGIEISALWCGWSGPCEWNLVQGPVTIGLVPAAYRHKRLETLMKGADFAAELGVEDIVTHVGFIPNNPFDPDYPGLVGALRHLAIHCLKNGQNFLFETGQEAPVTLLRTIEDVGTPNLGVNLDPANLLMYGYGNPIDSLNVFGKYVRNVHGKDGMLPGEGKRLGGETPIGQGQVNYSLFLKKLKSIGYDRYITIEREISGEQQKADILAARALIERLWAES